MAYLKRISVKRNIVLESSATSKFNCIKLILVKCEWNFKKYYLLKWNLIIKLKVS